MSGYRQWDTPYEGRKSNEGSLQKYNSIKGQLLRYKSIIKDWVLACKEGKNVIIMMDDNLDDSQESTCNDVNQPNFAKSSKLVSLFDLRVETLIDCNLIIHNKNHTFFKGENKSTIDHIYSNCPGNIDDINTITTGFSDHSMISCNYSTIVNNTWPKFAFKRDKSLSNKHNLEQFLDNNTYIDKLSKWEEPNLIAEILINELSMIVNSIAPKHKIQLSKKFFP